jgi:lipid-A-disaccharide synthase
MAPLGLTARDVLTAADAALVTSGTATLEAALVGVPMAAVYRTDPLSYIVGRYVWDIPYVALPNWILAKRLVPELLQDQVTEASLYRGALGLLDPREQKRQKRGFDEIRETVGGPGASRRVAALLEERL